MATTQNAAFPLEYLIDFFQALDSASKDENVRTIQFADDQDPTPYVEAAREYLEMAGGSPPWLHVEDNTVTISAQGDKLTTFLPNLISDLQNHTLAADKTLTATQQMVNDFATAQPGITWQYTNVTPKEYQNLTAFLGKHGAQDALTIPNQNDPSSISIDFDKLKKNPTAFKDMGEIYGTVNPKTSKSFLGRLANEVNVADGSFTDQFNKKVASFIETASKFNPLSYDPTRSNYTLTGSQKSTVNLNQAVADDPNLTVGDAPTMTQQMVADFFTLKEPANQAYSNVTAEQYQNITAFLDKHNARDALLVPDTQRGNEIPSNFQIDFRQLAANPGAVQEMEQIGRQMGVTEPQISFSQKMWKKFLDGIEKGLELAAWPAVTAAEAIDMAVCKTWDSCQQKINDSKQWLKDTGNSISNTLQSAVNAYDNAADKVVETLVINPANNIGRFLTNATAREAKAEAADLRNQLGNVTAELDEIKAQLAAATGAGAPTPHAANFTQGNNVASFTPVVEQQQQNFIQPATKEPTQDVDLSHNIRFSEPVTQDRTTSGLILDGSGRIKEGELRKVIDFEKLGMQYQGEDTTNNIQLTATGNSALNSAASKGRQ